MTTDQEVLDEVRFGWSASPPPQPAVEAPEEPDLIEAEYLPALRALILRAKAFHERAVEEVNRLSPDECVSPWCGFCGDGDNLLAAIARAEAVLAKDPEHSGTTDTRAVTTLRDLVADAVDEHHPSEVFAIKALRQSYKATFGTEIDENVARMMIEDAWL